MGCLSFIWFSNRPNTGQLSTKPFNEEYSNFLQEESFPALRQRIETVIKIAPQLKEKSLIHEPVDIWERGFQGAVKPLERLLGGEGYSRVGELITDMFSPLSKDTYEADEFKELTDRLQTFCKWRSTKTW